MSNSSRIIAIPLALNAHPSVAASFFAGRYCIADWQRRATGPLSVGSAVAAFVIPAVGECGEVHLTALAPSCTSDVFVLPDITTNEDAMLVPHIGTVVAVAMTIRQYLGPQSCHGHRYEIEPELTLAPLPLNPTLEQMSRLPAGSLVAVQGAFGSRHQSLEPRTAGAGLSTALRSCYTVKAGQEVLEIEYDPFTEPPSYKDGVLENLAGKPPITGERLHVVVRLNDEHRLSAYDSQAYLLAPDDARVAAYQQLRHVVELLMRKLENDVNAQEYRRARSYFAQLRRLELTRDEHHAACALIDSLPKEERSIYSPTHWLRHNAPSLLGHNPETLNREQFLASARYLLDNIGLLPLPASSLDPTGLFAQIQWPPFTAEDAVELLHVSAPKWFRLLDTCPDDQALDVMQALEACVGLMMRLDSSVLVGDLKDFILRCLESGSVGQLEVRQSPREARLAQMLRRSFDTLEVWKQMGYAQDVSWMEVRGWYDQLVELRASDATFRALERVLRHAPVTH